MADLNTHDPEKNVAVAPENDAESQHTGSSTTAASYQDINDTTGGEIEWTFSKYVADFRAADLVAGREKYLALTWKDLTVKGVAASESFMPTVWSNINPLEQIRAKKPSTRNIIQGFTGQLLPGEMLLVVGRPGSGCTTFMKALGNKREAYKAVEGEVRYGTLTAKEAENYRQQILFNTEGELLFLGRMDCG